MKVCPPFKRKSKCERDKNAACVSSSSQASPTPCLPSQGWKIKPNSKLNCFGYVLITVLFCVTRMISGAQTISLCDSCNVAPCWMRPGGAIKANQRSARHDRWSARPCGAPTRRFLHCGSSKLLFFFCFFCPLGFNDAELGSPRRRPRCAERQRYRPARVNEMTPVCLRVTVIFTASERE